MGKFHYRYQGLDVDSEFPIPEWDVFESGLFRTTLPNSPPDVLFSIAPHGGADLPPPEPGEYRFFVRDVGWFLVKRGAEIVVATGPIANPRRLRLCLIGSAWGALLYQRGLFPLHASAVSADGGAVLFCGRRGQGKSTLAALLTDRGYDLISDDLCRVTTSGSGTQLAYPSVPTLRLCADSLNSLGWDRGELALGPFRPKKLHYIRPSRLLFQPVPVRAIYLLTWGEAGFERLVGFSALNHFFSAATWRGNLLLSVGDPAKYFRQCTELVQRVPVWEFRRPRDFGAVAGTIDLLIGHLEQL